MVIERRGRREREGKKMEEESVRKKEGPGRRDIGPATRIRTTPSPKATEKKNTTETRILLKSVPRTLTLFSPYTTLNAPSQSLIIRSGLDSISTFFNLPWLRVCHYRSPWTESD
jgi:hypothetical protein